MNSVSSLPSRTEALNTLRKSGCSKNVINHSLLVEGIATEIASSINPKYHIDLDLVKIGALLHDIGRSTTHGIKHGSTGAEILERLGYPDRLVRIARNHVGAGIPREEATALGLSPADHLPETIEEKVVCYADKLVSGNTRVSFEEALTAFTRDLGPEHPGIERFRNLHREIVEMMGGDGNGTHASGENSSRKR
jgi:uncharacterized protein